MDDQTSVLQICSYIIPYGITAMFRGFTDLSTSAFNIGAMETSKVKAIITVANDPTNISEK